MRTNYARATILAVLLASSPAVADSDAELAKKTQNPIAAMISLPLQLNYDSDIGPTQDGNKTLLNVQPVIPFSIGTDWNLISRTIVPLINQQDVAPGAGTQSGVGDITQSLFFSPKEKTASGWIWGAGPVLLLRSGSDDLTADKWGLGPNAVFLKQDSGWTYGALANHIWSVAGDDQRRDISSTFLQPFLSYTTKTFTTFGVNTESSYDWKSEQWSVPLNFSVTQLLKVGGQPLTLSAGARYWADSPDRVGPEGWGLRLAVTFLFPK
ncbi:MAG: hypothetical protein Q8O38_09410 [Sulfurimicrobium sp.]|nr:hypothetical protein [Sulfurimicrobium sp.]